MKTLPFYEGGEEGRGGAERGERSWGGRGSTGISEGGGRALGRGTWRARPRGCSFHGWWEEKPSLCKLSREGEQQRGRVAPVCSQSKNSSVLLGKEQPTQNHCEQGLLPAFCSVSLTRVGLELRNE